MQGSHCRRMQDSAVECSTVSTDQERTRDRSRKSDNSKTVSREPAVGGELHLVIVPITLCPRVWSRAKQQSHHSATFWHSPRLLQLCPSYSRTGASNDPIPWPPVLVSSVLPYDNAIITSLTVRGLGLGVWQ